MIDKQIASAIVTIKHMTDDANKPKNINKVSSPTNQFIIKRNTTRGIKTTKERIPVQTEYTGRCRTEFHNDHPFLLLNKIPTKSPKARTENNLINTNTKLYMFSSSSFVYFSISLSNEAVSFMYASLDIFLFFPFIVSFPSIYGSLITLNNSTYIKSSSFIEEDFIFIGKDLVFSGETQGNLVFIGDNITVTDTAKIGGKLTIKGKNKKNI